MQSVRSALRQMDIAVEIWLHVLGDYGADCVLAVRPQIDRSAWSRLEACCGAVLGKTDDDRSASVVRQCNGGLRKGSSVLFVAEVEPSLDLDIERFFGLK